MQEAIWFFELIRMWIDGAPLEDIVQAPQFFMLACLAAALVPASVIILGIGGTHWRDTPVARWFGFKPYEEDNWAERARDIDKDGMPDI